MPEKFTAKKESQLEWNNDIMLLVALICNRIRVTAMSSASLISLTLSHQGCIHTYYVFIIPLPEADPLDPKQQPYPGYSTRQLRRKLAAALLGDGFQQPLRAGDTVPQGP